MEWTSCLWIWEEQSLLQYITNLKSNLVNPVYNNIVYLNPASPLFWSLAFSNTSFRNQNKTIVLDTGISFESIEKVAILSALLGFSNLLDSVLACKILEATLKYLQTWSNLNLIKSHILILTLNFDDACAHKTPYTFFLFPTALNTSTTSNLL